jgi:hypothetical protein
VQLHFDDEPQRFIEFAGFYTAFELMSTALNPHIRVAWKGGFGKNFSEPLPDFFQVAEHAEPSPAVSAGYQYKL